MASSQGIKKRIRGAQSIHQMTAAMELVAATKMRRAQELALESRPFATAALEILANVLEYAERNETLARLETSPMGKKNSGGRTAVILVASDKGLAGSFNSSVTRQFERALRDGALGDDSPAIIAVGQKAADYARRKGLRVVASLTKMGDAVNLEDITALVDVIVREYSAGEFSRVYSFSAHFRSALKQDVLMRQLLPLEFSKIRKEVEDIVPETGRFADLRKNILSSRDGKPAAYTVEPSPQEAIDYIMPLLFRMEVYHLILEANASEHSARRMAMKNATDNAGELISGLVLDYNRVRQANITGELTEIAGTMSAMAG